SYVNGQLTVVADNSMMIDVLNGIRSATGIRMEGLSGGNDRVFGQFGPGSPRVVIDSLLTGSHYDFIILSSLETPDKVQRLILSPRGSNPNSMATTGPGRAMNRPAAEEDNEMINTAEEAPEEQPAQPAPVPAVQQPGQPSPVNPSTVQNQGQQQGQGGTQNV